VIANLLALVSTQIDQNIRDESKANDCAATPASLSIVQF
jgi:hypothetical protein